MDVDVLGQVVEGAIVLVQVLASIRHLREEGAIDALLKWTIQQDARIDRLEMEVFGDRQP